MAQPLKNGLFCSSSDVSGHNPHISVGVAWIWPSSWPMRIWWPRPRSSQGMTILHDKYMSRNRTRIVLEIEVSLEFSECIWKQCFGKDSKMWIRLPGSCFLPQCGSGSGDPVFTSMLIRIRGYKFYLNADPDPVILFLPHCGSSSNNPAFYFNVDPAPEV